MIMPASFREWQANGATYPRMGIAMRGIPDELTYIIFKAGWKACEQSEKP